MTNVRGLVFVIAGTMTFAACGHAHDRTASDEDFVSAMVPHHRLGIEMLEHAVPRVDDVRVRRLVFEMSGYHDDELHQLENHLAHGAEATIFPGWIAPDRLAALDDRTGPEYDVGWLVLMIEHHEGAIELATDELARITRDADPARHDFASRIATTQRAEIDEMQTLVVSLCAEHLDPVPCDQVKPQP